MTICRNARNPAESVQQQVFHSEMCSRLVLYFNGVGCGALDRAIYRDDRSRSCSSGGEVLGPAADRGENDAIDRVMQHLLQLCLLRSNIAVGDCEPYGVTSFPRCQ